jgi:hypothetical protein
VVNEYWFTGEDMKNKIWVVEGATGEYSDHMEWPVKAFTKEEYARLYVDLCTTEYRRIKILRESKGMDYYSYERMDEKLRQQLIHKYDPGFKEDYTGTVYSCYSVEIEK